MQKLTGIVSGEKNRLHKLLTDAGIRLSLVVSDLHGKSARAMIKGLLDGETPEQVLNYADKRLKATEEELLDALAGDLTPSHRFIITEVMGHLEELDRHIQSILPHVSASGLGALLVYFAKPANHSRHRRTGRGDVAG